MVTAPDEVLKRKPSPPLLPLAVVLLMFTSPTAARSTPVSALPLAVRLESATVPLTTPSETPWLSGERTTNPSRARLPGNGPTELRNAGPAAGLTVAVPGVGVPEASTVTRRRSP